MKALQNKPEKRYRNVREIRKVLQSEYIRQGGTPPGGASSTGQHGTAKSHQKNPPPTKKKDSCLPSCVIMFILFAISMIIIGDRESTEVLINDRIVVNKLAHPPQFLVSDEWSWNFAGMGEGLSPYRDTYVYYPEDVGEADVELTPLYVRDTTSLASKIRFRVRGRTHSTAPLDHVLSIRFAMPLNNEYPKGRGSFAVIPGKFNSFTVETPVKWEKDEESVRIHVTEPSRVEINLSWVPSTGQEVIRVESDRRRGPRMLVNLFTEEYSWQFTTGFVILK